MVHSVKYILHVLLHNLLGVLTPVSTTSQWEELEDVDPFGCGHLILASTMSFCRMESEVRVPPIRAKSRIHPIGVTMTRHLEPVGAGANDT